MSRRIVQIAEVVTARDRGVPRLRWARVAAVVTGPPASVTLDRLDGSDTSTIEGVRYLAGYTPTVGDTVVLVVSGTDLVVLGALA